RCRITDIKIRATKSRAPPSTPPAEPHTMDLSAMQGQLPNAEHAWMRQEGLCI
ncbi:hypothetical protein VP01_12567g1, partial [Puccinia sorghi]